MYTIIICNCESFIKKVFFPNENLDFLVVANLCVRHYYYKNVWITINVLVITITEMFEL